MVREHETSYRYQVDVDAAIDVRFLTSRGEVVNYAIVLPVYEHDSWRAVRSYDNAHQAHDMHRYNRAGEKRPAIAGRPARYPSGAAFVGADLPDLGKILAQNAREERAVVLVYPDGQERVIEPHRPHSAPTAA